MDLADKHKSELGFLPRTIYQPLADAGRLYVATENDDPCGFLMRGTFRKTLKIYQTCVQLDARRLAHASDCLTRLIEEAKAASVHQITLHCAEDLEANQFWEAAGFQRAGERIKSKRTGRRHLRWWLDLPCGIAHREALDTDPLEITRRKLLELQGTWEPNNASIKKEIAKRRE